MDYFYLKALHLVFIITWFSGLFYIVRLFIYHVEAYERSEQEQAILIPQFTLMEKRLWYGITWPSAILTAIFGISLIRFNLPLIDNQWLKAKFVFLLGLFSYHFYCGLIRKRLVSKEKYPSSTWLRVYNEGATVFLIAIVFLAVLKDTLAMWKGLTGLIIFTLVLLFAIKTYRKIRSK